MELDLTFHTNTVKAFEALSLQRWFTMNVEEMIEQMFFVQKVRKELDGTIEEEEE